MDDFLLRAILGAGLLGAACGPVGAFVLWRRMAYLGESIAHMGILGAALGLLLGIAPLAGVGAICLAAALIMARADDGLIPAGTFIGIVGSAGLALGFVLLSSMETVRADLLGYLFGDVLAFSARDVMVLAAVSLAALAGIASLWRPLLAATVSPDIAVAEGAQRRYADLAFLILVAVVVALGLRVVGALLVVALLIVPPAAARPLARTPEGMAIGAAIIGTTASPLGITAAWFGDIPAGPAIVLAAVALFVISLALSSLMRFHRMA